LSRISVRFGQEYSAGELIDKINYDFDINETNKPSHDNNDIDVMPEFVGKDFTIETEKVTDFREYLASEIVYPPRAYKYYVQGKVYVQFLINEDGSISNALVVRTLDKDLDKGHYELLEICQIGSLPGMMVSRFQWPTLVRLFSQLRIDIELKFM
jgi:hypothetical protein